MGAAARGAVRCTGGARGRPQADRLHDAPADPRREPRPGVRAGRAMTPRRCSSRSDTRSSRPTRRGRTPRCCRHSRPTSARRSPRRWRSSDGQRSRADRRGHGAAQLGDLQPLQGHRLRAGVAGDVPAARRRSARSSLDRGLRLPHHARAGRGAGGARHDQPCSDDPMADFARSGHFTPYTAGQNITGSPAISLPLYHRDDLDLPVGVQIIGQPAGEGDLLALAAQLEAALPWHDRRAAI